LTELEHRGDFSIRAASPDDLQDLLDFNLAMARETEHKQLDPDTLKQGLQRLLSAPELGFYLVAECDRQVVACLMITSEWSDWRNGLFWWIQSVYVRQAYRRRGAFSALFESIRQRALRRSDVCGLRLYVERDNQGAQLCYRNAGMTETAYRLFERSCSGTDTKPMSVAHAP